jgi:hypothetical protein
METSAYSWRAASLEVSGKFQFSWPLYKDGLRVLEGK